MYREVQFREIFDPDTGELTGEIHCSVWLYGHNDQSGILDDEVKGPVDMVREWLYANNYEELAIVDCQPLPLFLGA